MGGVSELQLHLHPESEALFDTELVVAVRGQKRLTLKLVGAAEEPRVTIDRVSLYNAVISSNPKDMGFWDYISKISLIATNVHLNMYSVMVENSVLLHFSRLHY